MKMRKIPMRCCVGCGQMKPKKELLRIVVAPTGEIGIDRTGKAAGRGAYICMSSDCLEKAYTAHGLERSLKQAVSPDVYRALMDMLP